MADYVLPDLPYDYGALAPHISGEIMELHHDKHHATYVKGLNTALDQLAEARDKRLFGSVGRAGEDARLQPRRTHQPLGLLAEPVPRRRRQADRRAGRGHRRVLRQLRQVPGPLHGDANTIQGSGWSMLVWDALGQRLNIVQLYDQQANLPLGADPDRAAGHVGARVLPAVQERQGRLREGLVERGQLGGRPGPLHRRGRADPGAPHALSLPLGT